MPSYFYHLKFELYPSPTPDTNSTTTGSAEREEREIWVPPPGTDIFDSSSWPRHKPVTKEEAEDSRHLPRRANEDLRKSSTQGEADQLSTGAVIDCGPSRATTSDHDTAPLVRVPTKQRPNFSALAPRDQRTAIKDWRFGRVRVEGVDMLPTAESPSSRPARAAEAEGRQDGINAGLATGASGGRVTKAEFRALEGKNTEVGWGIVHLYRDGEETPGLGSGVDVYQALEGGGNAEVAGDKGEREDCTTLCIPAVPSYLTPSDFLGFVGEKTREEVSHFRMVMTGRMNRYLVLMKFRDNAVARKWRAEWDGKVFNDMEPETCHVTFIKSITFQTSTSSNPNSSFPELSHDPFTPSAPTSTFLKPFPPPTPNLVELPTCPVCLERMDDTTGLLTILCQHVFHCACLQKWRGTGCPVCRHTNPSLAASQPPSNPYQYDSSNPPFGSGEASLCSVCDCTDDLWICLICGNVGCGRYKGGHAKEHWKESAHNFALEIETQHVWDYAGDMWVHRLIRDKGDSKLIELPSSSSRSGLGSGQRGGGGGGTGDMEMVPREKLDRIGMEYTHLLTSQLESQRVYFEELVSKAAAKASAATSAAAAASARADEALAKLSELSLAHAHLRDEVVPNLEKDLAREKKRAERSSEVARGFGKSLTEEKKVSEGLLQRVSHVNASMMKLSKELGEVKEENAELREQNRDLLFSISARQKLEDMKGEEGLEVGELEGGTVSVPVEKERERERKRGKGKGRGK